MLVLASAHANLFQYSSTLSSLLLLHLSRFPKANYYTIFEQRGILLAVDHLKVAVHGGGGIFAAREEPHRQVSFLFTLRTIDRSW